MKKHFYVDCKIVQYFELDRILKRRFGCSYKVNYCSEQRVFVMVDNNWVVLKRTVENQNEK